MIVPVRSDFAREELRTIKKYVSDIKCNMPRKSEYQERLDNLVDESMKKDEIIRSQAAIINRLTSLNEKLLEYIDNIEEIKSSGGINTRIEDAFDFTKPRMISTKRITIPEVTLVVVEAGNETD